MVLGRVWQYKVLCLGLTTAPHLFTWAVQPLAVWVGSQSIHMHVYLDDWLFGAEGQEVLKAHTQEVLKKAQELGCLANLKNLPWRLQAFDFPGMQINTQESQSVLFTKRIEISTCSAGSFIQIYTTAMGILRPIGCIVSVASLIPQATLERSPAWFALRVWDGDMRPLDRKVQVTLELRNAVLWWAKFREHLVISLGSGIEA